MQESSAKKKSKLFFGEGGLLVYNITDPGRLLEKNVVRVA